MLKLLNPYSILAVLAVAGLLFGAGYMKGRMDGKNATLSSQLKQANQVAEKTEQLLTLKREIKHEGQNLDLSGIIDDLCDNGWMRDKNDCGE